MNHRQDSWNKNYELKIGSVFENRYDIVWIFTYLFSFNTLKLKIQPDGGSG